MAKAALPFPDRIRMAAVCAACALVLAGCEEGAEGFNLGDFLGTPQTAAADDNATAASGEVIERDVEAPDVFQVTEAGLWDGRPSLGGVWVAHPDVTDPERVIIRNTTNNQFVVGALFRRERDIPGPRLQISSDAAEALGMLAGAPARLNVTALRKETVEVAPPPAEEAPEEVDAISAAAPVETATLDPISSAAAAIESAPATPPAGTATPAPAAEAEPAPARASSSLGKPFLQVGIFSVQENANRAADLIRNGGMIPTIKKGEREGKPFWRVVVGPARSTTERSALLAKIKAQGFGDAYPVTN